MINGLQYGQLRRIKTTSIAFLCLFGCSETTGQDLEPRAYLRIPVNANVVLTGFSHSHGKVLTDPSVPLQDFTANVETFTIGYARTFILFGLTAQAFTVLP